MSVTVRQIYELHAKPSDFMPFMVVLCAPGNPDYRQYAPIAPPGLGFGWSIGDSVASAQKYIAEFEIGGGNWGLDSGKVYDARQGRVTHRIAFNGTVWPIPPEEVEAAQVLQDMDGSGLHHLLLPNPVPRPSTRQRSAANRNPKGRRP